MARELEREAMGLSPDYSPEMERAEADLDDSIDRAKAADDEVFRAMSPQGQFSASALNGLVKAHNKVLKLFGLEDYPQFKEDQTEFPEEFTRQLAMIIAAASDAVAQDLIEPGLVPSLDEVSDDTSLRLLSGKLDQLAKSKEFKRFLKEAPPEEEEEVLAEEATPAEAGPSDIEIDELFAGRM